MLRTSSGLWLVAGQGASSLGNLFVAVLIARESSAVEFAAFALVVPLYILFQRFSRVYVLIPRQIALNLEDDGRVRPDQSAPLGACLSLSLLWMAVLGVLALTLDGVFAGWLYWFVALVPGLALYDCVRSEFLALRRMFVVAALDGGWLAMQTLGSIGVLASGGAPALHLAAWGLPPLVLAAAIATREFCARWSLFGGVKELWASRRLFSDGLSDLISSVLVVQAIPYLVLALTSLETAGALRAGQMLLGPVNIIVMGLMPLLQVNVARLANYRDQSFRVLHKHTIRLSVLCTAYGSTVAFLPDFIGRQLLGDTWSLTDVMLVGLAVHLLMRTPFTTVVVAMRSLQLQRILVRQRMIGAVLLIGGAVLGALSGPASAIPWGMATAAFVSAVWAYVALTKADWGRSSSDRVDA